MTSTRILVVVAALAMPFALLACPPKETDKDVPSAQPVVTAPPPPTASAVLAPEEDAGSDASDAADGDGSDGKVVVGVSNLTKCCNAIKQNQKSAPPDQQLLYGAAISLCNSGAIPPQFRNLPQCK